LLGFFLWVVCHREKIDSYDSTCKFVLNSVNNLNATCKFSKWFFGVEFHRVFPVTAGFCFCWRWITLFQSFYAKRLTKFISFTISMENLHILSIEMQSFKQSICSLHG
jgi:hypothetical protein